MDKIAKYAVKLAAAAKAATVVMNDRKYYWPTAMFYRPAAQCWITD